MNEPTIVDPVCFYDSHSYSSNCDNLIIAKRFSFKICYDYFQDITLNLTY